MKLLRLSYKRHCGVAILRLLAYCGHFMRMPSMCCFLFERVHSAGETERYRGDGSQVPAIRVERNDAYARTTDAPARLAGRR